MCIVTKLLSLLMLHCSQRDSSLPEYPDADIFTPSRYGNFNANLSVHFLFVFNLKKYIRTGTTLRKIVVNFKHLSIRKESQQFCWFVYAIKSKLKLWSTIFPLYKFANCAQKGKTLCKIDETIYFTAAKLHTAVTWYAWTGVMKKNIHDYMIKLQSVIW